MHVTKNKALALIKSVSSNLRSSRGIIMDDEVKVEEYDDNR